MAEKGKNAFLEYYRSVFGDRWNALELALDQLFLPVLLIRPDKEAELAAAWQPLPWFPHGYFWPTDIPMGTKLVGVEEGWVYPLSLGSLLPVKALDLQPTDEVFDACAAPGGKTVAMYLQAKSVWANDLSSDRTERLKRTVQRFGASGNVSVSQGVVEVLARRMEVTFDKILIDAPCSSEVHVYHSPEHLAQWSYKRVSTLHRRQVNMITSCLSLLREHGRLVYSTCALTPEENEAVVAEVLQQVGDRYGLVDIDWDGLPGSTDHAMHRVWPDQDHLEPMFVAAFERSHS
jgi:16S rRNA C967 or C1407 C5-methylase (RsmB/RsmF family)